VKKEVWNFEARALPEGERRVVRSLRYVTDACHTRRRVLINYWSGLKQNAKIRQVLWSKVIQC
jgi:hypothetical protein